MKTIITIPTEPYGNIKYEVSGDKTLDKKRIKLALELASYAETTRINLVQPSLQKTPLEIKKENINKLVTVDETKDLPLNKLVDGDMNNFVNKLPTNSVVAPTPVAPTPVAPTKKVVIKKPVLKETKESTAALVDKVINLVRTILIDATTPEELARYKKVENYLIANSIKGPAGISKLKTPALKALLMEIQSYG